MAKSRDVVKTIFCALILGLFLQFPAFFLVFKFSQAVCNNPAFLTSVSSKTFHLGIISSIKDSFSLQQQGNVTRSSTKNIDGSTECSPEAPSRSSDGVNVDLVPHGHAHYPFVQFSAFRGSSRTFFIVGISSVVARSFDQPVHKCKWLPANVTLDQENIEKDDASIKVTDAEMMYINYDENGQIYAPATVNCTFSEDIGVDGDGGKLFITISIGPDRGSTTTVLALKEKQGVAVDLLKRMHDPSPAFLYAFCGPPMHSTIRAEWVLHWLVYHHYLWNGKAHFFFYNVGGLTQEGRRLLLPFLKAGLLTIIDAPGQKFYSAWYYNQLLFINDCLHRSRFLASWTFYHDFDEFLHIPPPNTLPGLLNEHQDFPWMTFGNLPASNGHCRDPAIDSSEWPLQRMLWVEKKPECMHPKDPWTCTEAPGRRKYVVNAKKVFLTGVHKVAVPSNGGKNFNAAIARVHHYHGVLSNKASPCGTKVNLSQTIEHLNWAVPGFTNYNRDDSIAVLVGKAREFAAAFLRQ